MAAYVVIENMPGYLPMDDDPFVTDDLRSANEALQGMVERHCDFLADGGESFTVSWDGDYPDESWSCAVVTDRPHDLGMWFGIVEAEDDV
jgi:hypothetical protein